MSRARSALAVRTTKKALIEAALKAFGCEQIKSESQSSYDGVLDFCRDHSEDLGGAEGSEAWYIWSEGEWSILGDLTLQLCRNESALKALSDALGEVVVVGIDSGFEFALFSLVGDGDVKRLLMLEDDEIVDDGYPIKAERGQYMDDFGEEEANTLWMSYGLSTLELDPAGTDFTAVAVHV